MGELSFENIRERVIGLLHSGLEEVNNKTKYKCGGIYMIYVDDFMDSKIIPCYIGKTSDFQRRHKQHIMKIMALNHFSSKYYNELLFDRYYDGKFMYCKMFAYMVNHKCTFNQLHMVILEKIDSEELRSVVEDKYISDLCTPYVGFNQLKSHTYDIIMHNEEHTERRRIWKESNHEDEMIAGYKIPNEKMEKYYELLESDIRMCSIFSGYGYTDFNVLYTLPTDVRDEDLVYKNAIKAKTAFKNLYFSNSLYNKNTKERIAILDALHSSSEAFENTEEEIEAYTENVKIVSEKMFNSRGCRDGQILEHFINCMCGSDRYTEDEITNWIVGKVCEEFNPFQSLEKEYLDVFKECKRLTEQLTRQRKEMKIASENESSHRGRLPYEYFGVKIEYEGFPLKGIGINFSSIEEKLTIVKKNDQCVINFILSCGGRSKYLTPRIIAIQYGVLKSDGERTSGIFFIDGYCEYSYVERDAYLKSFSRSPFEPIPSLKDQDTELGLSIDDFTSYYFIFNSDLTYYMTVSAEYWTGINDYTIHNNAATSFSDAIENIEKMLSVKTKVSVISSESKNQLSEALKELDIQKGQFIIIDKLIQ